MTMRRCRVEIALAKVGSGAVIATEGADGTSATRLDNSTFIGCQSQQEGGVLSVSGIGPVLEVNGCNFTSNLSGGNGGVVFMSADHVAEVLLRGSVFHGNAAQRGGALYGGAVLTVRDCSFTKNTAALGGAAFLTPPSGSMV